MHKGVKMENKCGDKNCPVHGSLRIKGAAFLGTVVSDKMTKTVTVQWTRKLYIPKFERYQVRLSKIKAHNPPCINAKAGDYVKLRETRPLSKTKTFVVVEKLGKGLIVKVDYEQILTKAEREKLKEKDGLKEGSKQKGAAAAEAEE